MKRGKRANRFLKQIACFVLLCSVVSAIFVAAPAEVRADNFVEQYRDMIGQGGYIYYVKTKATSKGDGAVIYRMKVATAEKSKVIEASQGVINMRISGQYLYFTTYSEDGKQWVIWRCGLNGSDAKKVCDGCLCYADRETVYAVKYVSGDKTRLFARDTASGKSTSIKTIKGHVAFDYVCSSGSTSYFYAYYGEKDKLLLYMLSEGSTRLVRVATEKRADNDSNSALLVSDVAQINGELYYDYGSYEGTGNFWNGAIKKLTTDGKKKTVGKDVGSDKIVAGSKELYFNDTLNNYYKYNLGTGKKSKYSLEYRKGASYIILGDKTYMADTSNKKKITISRFNSGTAQETLTKDFISIPFKQKANVSYSVSMKQVGIYNMVCVTGTDFTDAAYGWRGKLVSVDWYITDGAGTVLGSFR